MGDVLTPFTVPSPPPPSSSSIQNNNMSMLYYGLVMMGTAAIVLAIYNIIIIKHCNRSHTQSSSQSEEPNPLVIIERVVEIRNLDNSQRNLLSSFKYKKEVEKGEGGVEEKEGGVVSNDYDCECPVCLSVYEEGEEVKKLPKCKHSFHALCIDMWLYSHFDCPVCRTPVGDSFCNFPAAENSRGGLMESGGILD